MRFKQLYTTYSRSKQLPKNPNKNPRNKNRYTNLDIVKCNIPITNHETWRNRSCTEPVRKNGERLNQSALTCVLSTCADMAAFELGKQIHGRVIKAGYEFVCYVGNALLAMYCRCGSIDEAYAVFMGIEDKDVVSWNTIVTGYARHGFRQEALKHFESMKQASIQPDEVTMVGVLSACSHTGLVDTGHKYFYSMTKDYGVLANSKHYTCMIDLLGRSGRLDDAQNLMKNMPFEPDAATWGALLGASRIHRNATLGEKSC